MAKTGSTIKAVVLGGFLGVLTLGVLIFRSLLTIGEDVQTEPSYFEANKTLTASGCIYEEGKPRTKKQSFTVTFAQDGREVTLQYNGATEQLKFEQSTLFGGDYWVGPNFTYHADPEQFLMDNKGLRIGPNCD